MLDLFRKRTCPIGIDLGAGMLKIMQLAAATDGGLNLVAAAQAEVPPEIRSNPVLLQEWYVETVRNLLAERPFKGNRVVTALPARDVLVQHLRMPKMEPAELTKALPFEAQGKVPFDIHRARLCHVQVGEVYDGAQARQEIILMAASQNVVQQHLSFVERTKLDVQAINVEPAALVNSFAHLLEKAGEKDGEKAGATMFIDLGHSCAKVVITHKAELAFCRTVSSGAEHLFRAVADRLGVETDEARRLYLDYCQNATSRPSPPSHAAPAQMVGGIALSASRPAAALAQEDYDTVLRDIVQNAIRHLAEEVRGCVRYHDLLFPAQAVSRIVFLGGQAKNTIFCQHLARSLQLPAQLGDPLARINPDTRVGAHSDLHESERHCEWAIAFGLSLGSASRGK